MVLTIQQVLTVFLFHIGWNKWNWDKPNGKSGAVCFAGGKKAIVDSKSIVPECGTNAGIAADKQDPYTKTSEGSIFAQVSAMTPETDELKQAIARCCFIVAAALQRVKGNTEIATKWFKLGETFAPHPEFPGGLPVKTDAQPKSKKAKGFVPKPEDFPPMPCSTPCGCGEWACDHCADCETCCPSPSFNVPPTWGCPESEKPKTHKPKAKKPKASKPKTEKPKTEKPKAEEPKQEPSPPVGFTPEQLKAAQILGVKLTFPLDKSVVEKAFRTLAPKLHPDKTGGDDSAFKEANSARDTLLAAFPISA